MSTAKKIVQCLKDGTISCNLSEEFTNASLLKETGSSPTHVSLATMVKCNIPVAIKIFLDITKLPKNAQLEYERMLQIVQSLKYEIEIYRQIILPILNNNFSPNFVRFIGYSSCSIENVNNLVSGVNDFRDIYGNLLKKYPDLPVGVLVTEQAGGPGASISSLKNFYNNSDINENHKNTVMFQIVYSLAVMQKFRLAHNDLHALNVIVATLPKKVKRLYVVGKKRFLIHTRYVPYIFDWDTAYSDKLGNNPKITDKICEKYQICNRYSEKFDLYILLCALKWKPLDGIYKKYHALVKEGMSGGHFNITLDEQKRLLTYRKYIPSENVYKLGGAQLFYVFGSNTEKYFGPNVTSVMFTYTPGYELFFHDEKICRPTSYSSDMPTPMEILQEHFKQFETERVDFNEEDVYTMPESAQTNIRIYKDHTIHTRDKIQGYPSNIPKSIRAKNQNFNQIFEKQINVDKNSIVNAVKSIVDFCIGHTSVNTLVLSLNILYKFLNSSVVVPTPIHISLIAYSSVYIANAKLKEPRLLKTSYIMSRFKVRAYINDLPDVIQIILDTVHIDEKTSYDYMMEFQKIVNISKDELFLINFIFIFSSVAILYLPSNPVLTALGVFYISRSYFKLPWPSKLSKITGYSLSDIKKYSGDLLELFRLYGTCYKIEDFKATTMNRKNQVDFDRVRGFDPLAFEIRG